ncbi:MAG: hypothetical protein FJX57_01395 [Alphaproteobacteria bacterium]|nr:hypothetical protein [Alphaproteobacteria bacterium]
MRSPARHAPRTTTERPSPRRRPRRCRSSAPTARRPSRATCCLPNPRPSRSLPRVSRSGAAARPTMRRVRPRSRPAARWHRWDARSSPRTARSSGADR